MKSTKFLAAALALCVLAAVPALQAQKKGQGAMTPEQQIERIETAVGSLTAAQKTKITAIFQKQAEEMRGVPKEERKEKGATIQKKYRGEIRAVLTPEQQAKFDAMSQGSKKKKDQ